MNCFSLEGKVAVVTGASSGLGVAFAVGLAEAGADLVIGARREDRLAETAATVEKTGRSVVARRTDVTRIEDCDALVAAALAEFGHVDVLVNNAGASPPPRIFMCGSRPGAGAGAEGGLWLGAVTFP